MNKVKAARLGAVGMAGIALACAAMAATFVGSMLSARGYTGTRVHPIVVAARDLPAAQPITADDLEVRDWPQDAIPAGAFGDVAGLFAADPAPVPSAGILAGEPVVKTRLSSAGAGTGVARLVGPHMRAVALEVDDAVGKTRLVYPGAYVDVIVTLRDPGGLGPASYTAVQRARVLTLGADTDVATSRQRAEDDGGSGMSASSVKTCVTLEVTPQEAEILAMARNEGDLDLALRNGADTDRVTSAGATPSGLGKANAEAATPTQLATASEPGAATTLVGATAAPTSVASEPADAADDSARNSDRSARSSRSRRTRSRLEIVPHHEPDVASTTTIETYRAQ